MARKSKASELVKVVAEKDNRIKPPANLTPDEVDIWNSVVKTKPAEWFTQDTAPILTEYCRAASACNYFDMVIKQMMVEGNIEKMNIPVKLRSSEAARLSILGGRLRLTPQQKVTATNANTTLKKMGGQSPSNLWGDED